MDNSIVKHPGEILYSEISELGMKQKELAIRTGVSEKHISMIINGTKSISNSFARKLDIALNSENGTWAKKQADYDEYTSMLEERNHITETELSILKSLKDVVEYLLKTGIMRNHCGESEKILQLRKILCVNNLSVIPQISYNAAYRAQITKTTKNIDPYILFAWQRICEIHAENIIINHPFNPKKLLKSTPEIKSKMFIDDPNCMIRELKLIFAKCGIAFEVVHHFRGAPVQGFIKRTINEKVILCLTIRGKRADKFWFSLFHEIGHLLNGDLNNRFIDFDSVKSEIEENADAFARDALIDPKLYKEFILSGDYHNLDKINSFSLSAGVQPWITIGRLHNDEWLDWDIYANIAPSYQWAD
ncbi:helix-turn-helix domain-containing protein [bacterium]|nr:helix-turn-helix domain-containing protein [bacterium]